MRRNERIRLGGSMALFELAAVETILAVRDSRNRLRIRAEGVKPKSCQDVLIRIRPESTTPPEFEIVRSQDLPADPALVRYAVKSAPLPFPASAASVRIFTSAGPQDIPVIDGIRPPAPAQHSEPFAWSVAHVKTIPLPPHGSTHTAEELDAALARIKVSRIGL